MVRRVDALAELDDLPGSAAATRARAAAGDEDCAWIVHAWQEGRLLLARITVTVCADGAAGEPVEARRVADEIWLERDAPPAVEAQVAEIAPGELPDLARELRDRGARVQEDDIVGSYLHVELGERLRSALTRA